MAVATHPVLLEQVGPAVVALVVLPVQQRAQQIRAEEAAVLVERLLRVLLVAQES